MEPATHPGDLVAVPGVVGVPAEGDGDVFAGAFSDLVAAGEPGRPGVLGPLSEGVTVGRSAEGRGGVESACESPSLPPQAVRRQETATRTAPNQCQVGLWPLLRLLFSAVTTAPLGHRTPL